MRKVSRALALVALACARALQLGSPVVPPPTATSTPLPPAPKPRVPTTTAEPQQAQHLSLRKTLRAVLACGGSFPEFMRLTRAAHQEDVLRIQVPTMPPAYLLMGTAANRFILSDADASMDQARAIHALHLASPLPLPTPHLSGTLLSAAYRLLCTRGAGAAEPDQPARSFIEGAQEG